MSQPAQKGPDAPSGSTVKVIHTVRTMNCYVLFESDIENLSTLGFLQTAFISIASATGAFLLDLYKDTRLSASIPAESQEIISVAEPFLVVIFIASCMFASFFWWRRRTILGKIKKESGNLG